MIYCKDCGEKLRVKKVKQNRLINNKLDYFGLKPIKEYSCKKCNNKI